MYSRNSALIVIMSIFLTTVGVAKAGYVKNHARIAQVKNFTCDDLPVVEGEERRLLKCVVAPVGSYEFQKYPYEVIVDTIEESSRLSIMYNNTDYQESKYQEGVETLGVLSKPKNIKPSLSNYLSRKVIFSAEFRQGLITNSHALAKPHGLIIKKYFEAVKVKNKKHIVESREVYLVFRLNEYGSCYLGFVNEINTARNLADNLDVKCEN